MTSQAKAAHFTDQVHQHLNAKLGVTLTAEFSIPIGVSSKTKKAHRFDLGDGALHILVECKHYNWTKAGNSPIAKFATINEAMLHFIGAGKGWRKMFFCLKTTKTGKRPAETLLERYLRLYGHMVPDDVEHWEYDLAASTARRLH